MSDELARRILAMDFPSEDHARVKELSDKAREGSLSNSESAVLDDYIAVNDLLTILKAKARKSLQPPAAWAASSITTEKPKSNGGNVR